MWTTKELIEHGKKSPESMDELAKVIDNMRAFIKEYDEASCYHFERMMYVAAVGMHYNEPLAEQEISMMHSEDADGNIVKGRHWTAHDAKTVFERYKAKLPVATTVSDVDVVINSFFHDMYEIKMEEGKTKEEAEKEIIHEGIGYFLRDKDARENKLWNYMTFIPKR